MPNHPHTGQPWTCPTCGAGPTDKHRATTPRPTVDQLEEWMVDGVCEATDGCIVEPDGRCEHGHSSWMLRLGLI